ncbi:hypothetical protein HK405_008675, partial [Cladochytrium tenue]
GDTVVVGATTLDLLRQSLVGLDKGPLPAEIVRRIDGVWEDVSLWLRPIFGSR